FLFLWEIMAIASLLLVLVDHRKRPEVSEAGQWYGVMTHLGAASILIGFVLLAIYAKSQSFASIEAAAHHLPAWVRTSSFLLLLIGFGSKAGLVPLHVWLPKAHPEAPGPVSALMSAAMVNLGLYGVVRVGLGILGGGPTWWWLTVMALGAISAMFGSLHSATSTDLKRLLAYSTTDNIGLMFLGVGAAGLFQSTGHQSLALIALVAALLHMTFHALFKGSLFLSASSLQQATGSRDLDSLGGLMSKMPVTGSIFLIGSLSIAALPPLCGFVSEWLLLQSMLHGLPSSNPSLAIAMPVGVGVLALTGGLTALTFVKAVGIGILGQARSKSAKDAREVSPTMWVGSGVLAAMCFLFGVAPFLVIPSVVNSSKGLIGSHVTNPLVGGWQVGLLGNQGAIEPGLLAFLIIVFVAIIAGLRKLIQASSVRRAEAWGCGRETQTARMEYTATSFGEPVVRVFEDVLSPSHNLDASQLSESRYYVEAAHFHTSLDDAFERRFYRRAAAGLRWWGSNARRLPNGSIHRYLMFGMVALIVVLVALG
ncbi:MAG: hydrogenase 4 subunit B, partial [Acidimicrobiales bacterium]|nr:hydrogenase 4 subunit B [Acidimicrobiales bacterium]